jgi:hypothetical protein
LRTHVSTYRYTPAERGSGRQFINFSRSRPHAALDVSSGKKRQRDEMRADDGTQTYSQFQLCCAKNVILFSYGVGCVCFTDDVIANEQIRIYSHASEAANRWIFDNNNLAKSKISP